MIWRHVIKLNCKPWPLDSFYNWGFQSNDDSFLTQSGTTNNIKS
jgi:hypothetical protein